MLVRCPKCETGFNLPPAKVPEKGAKLRCSACTHTFRVKVSEDGQPLYVDKKGRPKQVDGDRTQLGGPLSVVESSLEEQSNQTQIGVGARSKSARQGYNPFPLAGGGSEEEEEGGQEKIVEESTGDSTQLFAGAPSTAEDDDDHDIALFEDDELLFDDEDDEISGDQTVLGPQARAPDRNGRQSKQRASAPAERDDSVNRHRGNSTQAFGSGGLDLFDGQKEQGAAPPPLPAGESTDISSETGFDPFEDAFDHPVDADVGLLMPSTPSSDDIEFEPDDSTLGADSSSDVGGMSEQQFLMGGRRSEFGSADELVDPEFGADLAAFDPEDGVVGKADRPKDSTRRRASKRGSELPPEELELVDVRTDEIARKDGRSGAQRRAQKPADRPSRQTKSTATEPRRAAERPPPKIGYVDGAGATSPLRRAFELAFISLVVVVAFAMFTSARAGWFFDFARVGHMLEVAFGSTEFVPRDEWQQIVEVEPAEPPPDEPLRLRNVRAFQVTAGETPLLVVTGKVRNYSLRTFSNVTTRARVLDADGEVLSEQTEIAGRAVDMSKLAAAKTADQAKKAIDTKVPDIGKEGSISVAFIFDDLDADVLESGEFDYDVAITD